MLRVIVIRDVNLAAGAGTSRRSSRHQCVLLVSFLLTFLVIALNPDDCLLGCLYRFHCSRVPYGWNKSARYGYLTIK